MLIVSNVRTGRMERIALGLEGLHGLELPKRNGPLGRVLVIPDDMLAADAMAQAAWFIDAIFGARTHPAPRFGSAPWEFDRVAPTL